MHLYELSQLYNDSLEEVLESDQDIDVMEALEGEFNDKAIAVTSFFKNKEADIAAIKEAEKAMKTRRTAMENDVKRLKSYLLRNMLDTGITKIECPYFKIATRKNPPSVVIQDESVIPDEFKITKTTVSIDKTAIKNAGGCEGAEIVQNKSLSIK